MISKHDKSLSCETPERRTARPAVGRADSDDIRDGSNGVRVGRRGFVKGLGATAAGAIALGSSRGPVGDVEAVPPLVIAGAALAGSVTFGWALREYEVIGSDSPAEGLTADAFREQAYQAAATRRSNNRSTVVDVQNIADGLEHTAWVEGKIAAIEALNEQLSESEVQTAAQDALDGYFTTLMGNLISTWEEGINELELFLSGVESHPDLTLGDVYAIRDSETSNNDTDDSPIEIVTETHDDFPWGQTNEYLTYESTQSSGSGQPFFYDGDGTNYEGTTDARVQVTRAGGDTIDYMDTPLFADANIVYRDVYNQINDALTLWVDNVYSDVQSGEIDVEELITPRERAVMMAEEEGMAQAIADLSALNIPVDVEREATVYLPHVDATVRGVLASTDEVNIESGETYHPSDLDGSFYLTYDASLGEGTWSAYDAPVDGGEVTFTAEPWESTTFRVHTIADESVELVADDFTAVDANGDPVDDWDEPDAWVVDISSDVETAITEIAEVEYFATDDSAQMETIHLSDSFTVERIEDTSTGEEETSMQFSSSEPQDDSNYITQEEWDDLESQNQELIEMYEDSQGGGSGLDLSAFDMFGVPGELVALVLAGAAAYLGIVNK